MRSPGAPTFPSGRARRRRSRPRPTDASVVHGESGLGHAALPEPQEPADVAACGRRDLAAARANAGKLTLVATGPLTNIALAVMREPDLPRLIKRFVIMGGAFGAPGNVTPRAEFNIWHDPEAARIVFRVFGGVGATPVVAVGLDVTRKTTFDEDDVAAFARAVAGKPRGTSARPLHRGFVAPLFRAHGEVARRAHLHDARSARARRRARSDAGQDAPRTVDVETSGRLTMGATIADWRGQWGRLANAEVAVEVDAERFRAMFFDAMARLADRA